MVAPFLRRGAKAPAPRVVFLRDRLDKIHRLRVWATTEAEEEVEELARSLRAGAEQAGTVTEVSVRRGVFPDLAEGPYGGPQAAPFFADMLADASPLLLDLLAEVHARRASRTALALDMMIAHMPAIHIAVVFPERYPRAKKDPGFPAAFPVYRSHADGFFIMSKDPQGARARFDAQYERASTSVKQRISAVLSQFNGGPVVSEHGARWHDLARKHLLRAEELVSSGAMTVRWDGGYLGDTHNLTVSLFHQIVQRSPGLRAFLRLDPGYLAARTMMSCLYLTLSNLGLRLVDRVFLCHAISRACEELFDVEAATIIRNLARAFGAGRSSRKRLSLAGGWRFVRSFAKLPTRRT